MGGAKDMKEFYGKALMRKAEALEQMERWKDAGDVWKMCVEHGVGASTAIQGRTRCEKALAPKPPPSRTATPKAAPRPAPRPSALSDLGPSGGDSAAVKRLREANANAEKADDEKFALSDQVEARIGAWKNGKEDNLRALIGSLEISCVFRNILNNAVGETAGVTQDVGSDPTLPRSNKACPKCKTEDAVFFQSQQRSAETGMKLFYVCCGCGHIFS